MTPLNEQPRTLLAALIARENLTLSEAVDKIEAVSRRTGGKPISLTPRHLSRLANAEREGARPNPALTRALQEMFGRPITELLAPYDAGALTTPGTTGALVDTAEVVTMAADRARRFAQLETTSGQTVDLLHEDVRDLAQAYPTRPLHELLGHLTANQDTVFSLLERAQRPEHSRRLYFLAAALGGMLGKASHDLADPIAAQTQLRTAWMCAEAADHHGLRAWVAGLQSLVSYWARRPHDAIRHAQRGAEYAQTSRSSAGVWLASNEARAWAALGNGVQAREAIARADAVWATVAPDDLDELGGIATFSRSRATYYAADALAWLPADGVSTVAQAERAVAAYADPLDPDWAFGDAAGSRCDLAIGRARAGDIEGAVEAVGPVLALPPEQRINGIVHSVNRLHTTLSGIDAPPAAGLQQDIEVFTRVPLQALPR